ncbi:hypothetical protein GYMLUDRAFT_415986 [Collybiopsis luxurians FD-317 M1]|nr:hypothetical protein GYMLUDRAFT_415986 [Collybiopsis luxurians FD-317 M1]
MTDVVVSQLIDDNSKASKVQHVYSTVLTHYRRKTKRSSTFPLPQWPGMIPSSWTSFLRRCFFQYWTLDTSRALFGCSLSNVDVSRALSTAFFSIMLIVGNRYSYVPTRMCCGVIVPSGALYNSYSVSKAYSWTRKCKACLEPCGSPFTA